MFTFYATIDNRSLARYLPVTPVLLPASSWVRDGLRPPRLPEQITETAADSGGYVASKIWGEYRYSLDQYVNWLLGWKPQPPQWAAMMDYCCEADLKVITRERQDKTTANALKAWSQYKQAPFVWTPTVQGLDPQDYRKHTQELAPLILEMQQFYDQRGQSALFRVGIGTLCKRVDSMAIASIVMSVRSILPNTPLHLWGIKLASLRAMNVEELGIQSTDSAAWSDQMCNSANIRAEANAAGMSQRAYTIKVKLPAYVAKVRDAAARAATLPNEEREQALAQAHAAIKAQGWTPRIRTRRAREYAYAVRRTTTGRLEERYIGPLDNPAVTTLAAALPNTKEPNP